MSSLREVKDRIASVRSTLKITSAMKLVASSKLVKAQKAIEMLRPYERALARILSCIPADSSASLRMTGGADSSASLRMTESAADSATSLSFRSSGASGEISSKTIVIAFAGNTSMCGAFNANVSKKTLEVIRAAEGEAEVWVFGRKMAEALRKEGIQAQRNYNNLIASPSSDAVSQISAELRRLYDGGEVSRIVLVYNHFVNPGKQVPVEEGFLPFTMPSTEEAPAVEPDYYILEPSAEQLAQSLVPQVLDLKLYAALLDSVAAEHAARMVAMQAATDNAEDLLAELTLEYNKGRQQKITAEILDLVAGEAG